MTFAASLAAQRPGEIALRDAAQELTWAEVDEKLRGPVNGLLSLELGPERRVAVFAANSADTLLSYVAVTLAGCSAVPVNFHLTADEAAYILADAGVGVVLADETTAARAVEAARAAGVPLVVTHGREVDGARTWTEWVREAGDSEPPTDRKPLPSLVYTSGTTGRPKGTELPPTAFVGGGDIAEHVERLAAMSWVRHGAHLVVGPMYHSGPLVGTRLLAGGAPVTVLARFDAETVLAAIERYRIGSTVMVPTHFVRLLALPEAVRVRYDVSSLKYVLQVGSKCAVDVKRAMIDWWGEVIWESYGASEVGTTCLIGAREWLGHVGSVGRPVSPFEVVVVDEDGDEVPPGVEGRLYFRDTTGRGIVYHQAPDKERDVHLQPGVFTLGEIGYVDDEGYVYITDRFSDMIVSGGVNIYPAESELVLATHPEVDEVACIGVPHAEMGEELVAVVVARDALAPPDPADVLAYCRDRLAHYKCPRSVQFAPSLPRSAMGKLDKRKLKAAFTSARMQVQ
ncbi:AMP-binding protein [Amycolatopsis sp. K13G38]|uniref:AMP-binding protein n=1 Tax=Amycolatopsis acididurans TaxID=2724524 RepID=A0ABX1JED6_9PSEU|nr:AMP-binding protein [Amycolatopsis acididurans]NKQ57065.1 AMP-binding protein [Amycolatopsis acididurans]